MSVTWSSRRYDPRDDDQLFELVRTHQSPGRTRDYWAWAFHGNPVATPVAVAVDDASGAVVGQYAVSRIPVNVGSMGLCGERREVQAAVSVDTVIHPSIRRQGAFVHLAEQVYRELAESGYQFVVACPGSHRNSKPGLLKLGFVPIAPLWRVQGNIADIRKTGRPRLPAPLFNVTPWKPYIFWRFASRPNVHYHISRCDRRSGELQVVRIEKDHVLLVYSSLWDMDEIYTEIRKVAGIYGRERVVVYGKADDPLVEHLSSTCKMHAEESGYTFMVKPLGHVPRMTDPTAWHPQPGWFDVF